MELLCCKLTARMNVLQDMSKLALEEWRAQLKAAQLRALAVIQPLRPATPAECKDWPSLLAAAQAAANTLAQKVPDLCMLPHFA